MSKVNVIAFSPTSCGYIESAGSDGPPYLSILDTSDQEVLNDSKILVDAVATVLPDDLFMFYEALPEATRGRKYWVVSHRQVPNPRERMSKPGSTGRVGILVRAIESTPLKSCRIRRQSHVPHIASKSGVYREFVLRGRQDGRIKIESAADSVHHGQRRVEKGARDSNEINGSTQEVSATTTTTTVQGFSEHVERTSGRDPEVVTNGSEHESSDVADDDYELDSGQSCFSDDFPPDAPEPVSGEQAMAAIPAYKKATDVVLCWLRLNTRSNNWRSCHRLAPRHLPRTGEGSNVQSARRSSYHSRQIGQCD